MRRGVSILLLGLVAMGAALLAGCTAMPRDQLTLAQEADFQALQQRLAQRGNPAAARVALLADYGTWPDGALAILESCDRAGIAIHAQDHTLLAEKNLAHFDTLILPGGWAPLQRRAAGPQGLAAVEAFAVSGHRVIGICAGAYLLARKVRWQSQTYDYMGLYDGTAVGPLNDYPSPSSTMLASDGVLPHRAYYLNGGCEFEGGTDVRVLARYPNGHAAVIERRVGSGVVLLLGVHPEVDVATGKPSADAGEIYRTLLNHKPG